MRVINAADYGMPQKRRRIYIFAEKDAEPWNQPERLEYSGILQNAFPTEKSENEGIEEFEISSDIFEISRNFGIGNKRSKFENSGNMQNGKIVTKRLKSEELKTIPTHLRDIIVHDSEVPEEYFLKPETIEKWEYLKGAKSEPRTTKAGFTYNYTEGPLSFPEHPLSITGHKSGQNP